MNEAEYGDFRVLETLGQGGMGVVYRAEHVGNGQLVALKVARDPSDGVTATVRREIRALERAPHPNIASIVAQGESEGRPWYAMELFDAATLRDEIRTWFPNEGPEAASGETLTLSQAPGQWASSLLAGLNLEGRATAAATDAASTGPPRTLEAPPTKRLEAAGGNLSTAIALGLALCEPLAFLHGEGIVHCDLKPDNIMLQDGRPILVDFGLNARFWGDLSREVLDLEGMATGTIAFMSPEQIRGALVDPRADLYALGCVLYVLLTGRPPFSAPTISALALQHLETLPSPPSMHVDGVPRALDALVLDMLAKDPRRRVGYADDVAVRLASLLPSSAIPKAPGIPHRPYVYRPRYVGRQRITALLDEHVTDVNHQQGAVIWVIGAQGAGKTRVLSEAAQRARNRGVAVYGGACGPLTAAGADDTDLMGGKSAANPSIAPQEALQLFRTPLSEAIDKAMAGGSRVTRRLFGPQGASLTHIDPRVAQLPGITVEQAVALSPELERDRLFTSLAWTLGALAVQRPMMVVVDDVQWADELSQRFIEYLLRSDALTMLPALFVCTSPPADVPTEGATVVELGPLSTADITDMVGDMLAVSDVPDALVEHLVRRADGMPYVVTEMVRTAVATGVLRRRRPDFDAGDQGPAARATWVLSDDSALSDASFEDLHLPETLGELMGQRLAALDEHAQSVARLVALLGPRCARETLARFVNATSGGTMPGLWASLTPETLDAGLDRLLAAHVLTTEEDGDLRFFHPALWSACYEALPPHTRMAAHERVARLFTGAGASHAAMVGHHWLKSGNIDNARPYYLTAARAARNSYALDTAEDRYRTWLSLIPTGSASRPRVDGIFEFVEILEVVGHWEEALELLREALEAAGALGDKALEGACHQRLGTLLNLRGEHEEAIVHLGVARRIFTRLGKIPQLGATLGEIGRILRRRGELDEAASHFQRQMTVAIANDNAGQQIRAHMNLGRLAVHRRETSVALEHFRQGHALSVEHRRRRSECRLQGDLGDAYLLRGEYQAAISAYESQLGSATTIGDRQAASSAIRQIGVAHWRHGSIDSALRCFSASLSIAIELGDRTATAVTLARVGDVLAARQELDLADRAYDVAIQMMRRAALHYYMGSALYRRAEVLTRLLDAQDGERGDGPVDTSIADVDGIYRLLGEAAQVAKRARRSRVTLAAQTLIRVLDARTGDAPLSQVVAAFEAQLGEASHPLDRAALLYALWRVEPTPARRQAAATAYLDPMSRISATARLRYAEVAAQETPAAFQGARAQLPDLPRSVPPAPTLSDIAGEIWTAEDWMGDGEAPRQTP